MSRIAGNKAVVFECQGDSIVGVLHRPAAPKRRGVILVVGGPQYRAGSHRQFKLLADRLAEHGFATLRFDHRGCGDSGGKPREFTELDDDIDAAIDFLSTSMPTIDEVVLWGLCDAASAILLRAARRPSDPRIGGIVLLNPWVRSEATLARTHLKRYYVAKLLDPRSWKDLFRGRLNPLVALGSLTRTARLATAKSDVSESRPYQSVMMDGMRAFVGPVLLVLSGQDLTAAEFEDFIASEPAHAAAFADSRVERFRIPQATHTFSAREWRDAVADRTLAWLARS